MILSSSLTGNLASILMEDSTDRIERQQMIIMSRLDELFDKLDNMEKFTKIDIQKNISNDDNINLAEKNVKPNVSLAEKT